MKSQESKRRENTTVKENRTSRIPKSLLSTKYRRRLWANAERVISALEKVLPVKEIHLTGSFNTKKKRPADVDFMIMLELDEKDKNKWWSVDLVTIPNNRHGKALLEDNKLWMKQKYGSKGYTVVRLKP